MFVETEYGVIMFVTIRLDAILKRYLTSFMIMLGVIILDKQLLLIQWISNYERTM